MAATAATESVTEIPTVSTPSEPLASGEHNRARAMCPEISASEDAY